MVLVNTWLPSPLCETLLEADLSKSLYETLRISCKIEFTYGERIIEAVAANEKEAEYLNVELSTPMLKVITISYLDDATPIEYSVAIQRGGDRSTIEAKVVSYFTYGKTQYSALMQFNYSMLSRD